MNQPPLVQTFEPHTPVTARKKPFRPVGLAIKCPADELGRDDRQCKKGGETKRTKANTEANPKLPAFTNA